MEEQKTKIELLENENQQWQILAQKLNSENSLLLKQNTELLNWNIDGLVHHKSDIRSVAQIDGTRQFSASI